MIKKIKFFFFNELMNEKILKNKKEIIEIFNLLNEKNNFYFYDSIKTFKNGMNLKDKKKIKIINKLENLFRLNKENEK